MTELDDRIADANPVPTPPPGRVTPDQERLLAAIVATPPRRAPRAVRLLAVTAAVAASVVAVVLVAGRGATTDDEREAITGTPPAGLIHVATRLYGEDHPRGARLDGWLEPATGRVRIETTSGGEIEMEQVVQADDRVITWQALEGKPDGFREDKVEPQLAESLRASVRDRMRWVVDTFGGSGSGPAATERGEYRGRPVTIHRIDPPEHEAPDEGTTCCYFKWFTDDSGATIAYERGYVVDASGKDVVMVGEELIETDTYAPGTSKLRELDPRAPTPTPG